MVGFPDGLSFQGYTVSRASTSCCAVALAQHSGQNSLSAQQPPQGWLPLAQHAILGAQHFFAAGLFFVVAFLFAIGDKKRLASLYLIRRRQQKKVGISVSNLPWAGRKKCQLTYSPSRKNINGAFGYSP